MTRPDLMRCHGALSALHHAVQTEFPFAFVTVQWNPHTYLTVEIDVDVSKRQLVVDRLSFGVLNGPYDYRFSMVSCCPSDTHGDTHISAIVNLGHDMRRVAREVRK